MDTRIHLEDLLRGYLFKSGRFHSTLMITALVIQWTYQQDSFYFDPAPIGLDVIEGEDVHLRCDVSNRKDVVFYWTLNGKTIVNTSRRFQDDSDLRIINVDRNLDSGSLRCVATNYTTGIALRSTEAKLNISWIDSATEVLLVKPLPDEIEEGVELILLCQVDGSPEPTVDWYRNKLSTSNACCNRIFPSDQIRFVENRLIISAVTAEYNGVYSCRAHNAAKTAESSSDIFLVNVPGIGTPLLHLNTFAHSVLVKVNETAVLNCQFSNAAMTEWYFVNNSVIANFTIGQKFTTLSNGSLIVHHMSQSDAGTYHCVGISHTGFKQTFSVELSLAYLGDLAELQLVPKPSFPQVIPVNGKFEVHCQLPPGLPLPSRRWLNPDQIELTDQGRIRATTDGQLIITNALEEDGGNYTCHVENIAEAKMYTIWIVVSVSPTIVRSPISVRLLEGESATFDCRVIATPHPVTVISWIKDELPLGNFDARYTIDIKSGTLKIDDVHMTDEGSYACIVSTIGHPVIQSTNGYLYVEKQLQFRVMPVHSKLELGSNSTIRCIADGRVSPQTRWTKTGSPVLPKSVFDSSGILSFVGVQRHHSGQYTCTASSEQGTINVTVNVDVVVKPKLKVKPFNTTIHEGNSAMMHCVATGDPRPTIEWDKNNRISAYDQSRFKVLSNGSLHILEVYMEDSGKYGCTAGNSGGFERDEAYLTVLSSQWNGRNGLEAQVTSQDAFSLVKTVTIAVCSAVAYLALVIGLIVYCSIRLIRNKTSAGMIPPESVIGANIKLPNETTGLVDKQRIENFSSPSLHPNSSAGSHNSRSFHHSYHSLAFPRSELQTLGMLGKGSYGDVFLAKAHGIRDEDTETLVVVKSLLLRSDAHQMEFERELELLSSTAAPHCSVVQLFGVCQEAEPMLLISEYCEWGDLKQFLLTVSKENNSQQTSQLMLSTAQKLAICQEVALGMEHLTANNLVHRDLAARNVLLSPSLNIKISILSLCRDVYAKEYFVFRQRPIPLRWMAPEAVLDEIFSTSSDIWSFGVFVWEVFAFAGLPFEEKTDDEVLEDVRHKVNQLPHPNGCPAAIYSIIENCMAENPKSRLAFGEALSILANTMSNIITV